MKRYGFRPSSTPVARWTSSAKPASHTLKISDLKTGLSTEGLFLVPDASEPTIQSYEKEVIPHTVGFMMTTGWYQDGAAPFHAYVRVGDRVFRIQRRAPPGGGEPVTEIVEESYGKVLREVLARDGSSGPITETREMVFSVSGQARAGLLEYFVGRKTGEVAGQPVETNYDVAAVGPDTYEDGRKQENCVTFSLSCIEPRFVGAISGLETFQRDANFYAPVLPSGSAPTAKQILGFLTMTARPDAVVLWARDANQKVVSAQGDPEQLKSVFHHFVTTLGGKRVQVEVLK